MNLLVDTDRLLIVEMTMDMAMDVHKNSLDEDTRRFVPEFSLFPSVKVNGKSDII